MSDFIHQVMIAVGDMLSAPIIQLAITLYVCLFLLVPMVRLMLRALPDDDNVPFNYPTPHVPPHHAHETPRNDTPHYECEYCGRKLDPDVFTSSCPGCGHPTD